MACRRPGIRVSYLNQTYFDIKKHIWSVTMRSERRQIRPYWAAYYWLIFKGIHVVLGSYQKHDKKYDGPEPGCWKFQDHFRVGDEDKSGARVDDLGNGNTLLIGQVTQNTKRYRARHETGERVYDAGYRRVPRTNQ